MCKKELFLISVEKLIENMALFWFGLRQNWRRFWQPFCPRFYMACTVVYHTLCPLQGRGVKGGGLGGLEPPLYREKSKN